MLQETHECQIEETVEALSEALSTFVSHLVCLHEFLNASAQQ